MLISTDGYPLKRIFTIGSKNPRFVGITRRQAKIKWRWITIIYTICMSYVCVCEIICKYTTFVLFIHMHVINDRQMITRSFIFNDVYLRTFVSSYEGEVPSYEGIFFRNESGPQVRTRSSTEPPWRICQFPLVFTTLDTYQFPRNSLSASNAEISCSLPQA